MKRSLQKVSWPASHPSRSTVMSPTCTLPYEVLFELTNDTPYSATVQAQRPEDSSRIGPVILLHSGESIALVLTAGRPYRYAARQHGREANLS